LAQEKIRCRNTSATAEILLQAKHPPDGNITSCEAPPKNVLLEEHAPTNIATSSTPHTQVEKESKLKPTAS
jgi:hypothetical protein